MKHYAFLVKFGNGKNVTVYAFNETDAVILAKAEMIKAGLDHSIILKVSIID